MRAHPVGPRALLVEVASPAAARSLAVFLRQACPDVQDIVPAAATVLLDGIADHERVGVVLKRWQPTAESVEGHGPVLLVPTRYDGADLAQIADSWGVSRREVVERHTSIEFTAEFCGFSPGFAYLGGLPERWAIPRRPSPRTRVPAGSVAIGGSWCAIYPRASPGGWSILGVTELSVWDQSRIEPALITAGTKLRFVEQSA